LICGITLICDETVSSFIELFSILWKATKIFPKSIITDQQQSMISALTELKTKLNDLPEFTQLLDQFHIIKNVQKQMNKRLESSNALSFLRTMLYTKSCKKYQ